MALSICRQICRFKFRHSCGIQNLVAFTLSHSVKDKIMRYALSNTMPHHNLSTSDHYLNNAKFKKVLHCQNILNLFKRTYSIHNRKLPIVYLFTKNDCSLCDEAKHVLAPYMHRFILEEVDITLPENADWYELYKYDIPVFHIYEEFLFQHKVDTEVLEKALQKYTHGFQ